MQALSFQRYVAKCVLGAEIFYAWCLVFGTLLTGQAASLHHAFLNVAVPGFIWGDPVSILWGIVYVAVSAFIFGAYMVWMFNTSFVSKK